MTNLLSNRYAILLPTYNGQLFLEETLRSLVNQDYPNFHIYIRDDFSNDESSHIIKRFQQKYPNLIDFSQNHENLGLSRNICLLVEKARSTCQYAVLLGQDDLLLPNHLTEINKLHAVFPQRVVYGKILLIDESGRQLETIKPICIEALGSLALAFQFWTNLVPVTGSSFPLNTFDSVFYSTNSFLCQDWIHWIFEVSRNGMIKRNSLSAVYRRHRNSTSSTRDLELLDYEINQGRLAFLQSKHFENYLSSLCTKRRRLFILTMRILAIEFGDANRAKVYMELINTALNFVNLADVPRNTTPRHIHMPFRELPHLIYFIAKRMIKFFVRLPQWIFSSKVD